MACYLTAEQSLGIQQMEKKNEKKTQLPHFNPVSFFTLLCHGVMVRLFQL